MSLPNPNDWSAPSRRSASSAWAVAAANSAAASSVAKVCRSASASGRSSGVSVRKSPHALQVGVAPGGPGHLATSTGCGLARGRGGTERDGAGQHEPQRKHVELSLLLLLAVEHALLPVMPAGAMACTRVALAHSGIFAMPRTPRAARWYPRSTATRGDAMRVRPGFDRVGACVLNRHCGLVDSRAGSGPVRRPGRRRVAPHGVGSSPTCRASGTSLPTLP